MHSSEGQSGTLEIQWSQLFGLYKEIFCNYFPKLVRKKYLFSFIGNLVEKYLFEILWLIINSTGRNKNILLKNHFRAIFFILQIKSPYFFIYHLTTIHYRTPPTLWKHVAFCVLCAIPCTLRSSQTSLVTIGIAEISGSEEVIRQSEQLQDFLSSYKHGTVNGK